MKVVVVGAGAIGTWIGDRLRGIGVEVVYTPRLLEAVEPVAAELAIVAVKSYDTPGAIAALQRALPSGGGATILTLQNGIGNEVLLAEAFGRDAIVAGAVTVPVRREADGRIVAAQRGGLALAPLGATAHNWLVAMLASTGVPIRVVADAAALKWSKLALNLIANASCAILDMPPEVLVADPRLFALEMRVLREFAAVMRAADLEPLDLPQYPVRALLRVVHLPMPIARLLLASRIAKARAGKIPSLLLDLRQGRRESEVTVLNGAVASEAARLGVAAPVNASLARLLAAIAAEPTLWATYRQAPERLFAEISR